MPVQRTTTVSYSGSVPIVVFTVFEFATKTNREMTFSFFDLNHLDQVTRDSRNAHFPTVNRKAGFDNV
jgi:hypothetical protein